MEVKIITPVNTGKVSDFICRETLQYVRHQLCDIFGGYTEMTGKGGYMSADGELITDRVVEFTAPVCHDMGAFKHDTCQLSRCSLELESLARQVRTRLNEDCIYIRHGCGTVELI